MQKTNKKKKRQIGKKFLPYRPTTDFNFVKGALIKKLITIFSILSTYLMQYK